MSAMRYRDVNGRGVLTPFEGHYRGFVRREGVMIPSSAEVAWLLPDGPYAYWRGKPTNVRFDLAPAVRPRIRRDVLFHSADRVICRNH